MIYSQLEIGSAQGALARRVYYKNLSLWPPPIVIPFCCLLEIFFFYGTDSSTHDKFTGLNYMLLFDSERRIQLWRYFTYVFIHAEPSHLWFNVLIQLAVGLPIEMIHGHFSIVILYLFSTIFAALVTCAFEPGVYLIGCSASVFALLFAHLANVFLNHKIIPHNGILEASGVFSVLLVQFMLNPISQTPYGTSTLAHVAGAITGFMLGMAVLYDYMFEHQLSKRTFFFTYLFVFCFFVWYNIFI